MTPAHTCNHCGHTPRPTPTDKRATKPAHNSDYDTGRCRHCDHPVLVGWTNGILTTLDAHPLNNIGEMAAIALGAATYTRHGARMRHRGHHERSADFPARPNTVHPTHTCDRTWPQALRLPLAGHHDPPPDNSATPLPAQPPF